MTWSEWALTLSWPATITLQTHISSSNHIRTGKVKYCYICLFSMSKNFGFVCHLWNVSVIDQPWHLPIRVSLYPRPWVSWRAPRRSEECTLLSGMSSLLLSILFTHTIGVFIVMFYWFYLHYRSKKKSKRALPCKEIIVFSKDTLNWSKENIKELFSTLILIRNISILEWFLKDRFDTDDWSNGCCYEYLNT